MQHTLSQASVTYQTKSMGLFNSVGQFKEVKAAIDFNPQHPEHGNISASLKVASLDSKNKMRDDHLKSKDFFEAEVYPEIHIQSASIHHQKDDQYIGDFTFKIKNKTKQLTIPFTYTGTANQGLFNTEFNIKRTDFNIGSKNFMTGNDIKVTIAVQTMY